MIRLAICDDHKMFREGLKALIAGSEINEVVMVAIECENGRDLLEELETKKVDLILMDLEMPVLNGIETMERLHQKGIETKVIIVSSHKEENFISHLMELGASGYLLKEADSNELMMAIQSVRNTGYYFNDIVSQSMLKKLAGKEFVKPTFNNGEQLSEREQEVLQLICKEHTTGEIAEELFISPRTVDGHRNRIMDKTGVRNTAGLVVYAIKNKLIEV